MAFLPSLSLTQTVDPYADGEAASGSDFQGGDTIVNFSPEETALPNGSVNPFLNPDATVGSGSSLGTVFNSDPPETSGGPVAGLSVCDYAIAAGVVIAVYLMFNNYAKKN